MIVKLGGFHPPLSHLQFSLPHTGSLEGLFSFQEGRGQSILVNVPGMCLGKSAPSWTASGLDFCVCLDLAVRPSEHQGLAGTDSGCLVAINWPMFLGGVIMDMPKNGNPPSNGNPPVWWYMATTICFGGGVSVL